MNVRLCGLFMYFVLVLFPVWTVTAQDEDIFPGGTYDPAIPTPYEIIGRRMGEVQTFHWEMGKYLHAAAEASERVQLFTYGKTYEERNLYYLLIGTPENLARIDEIIDANMKLTDPRITPQQEANEIAESIPAIVWLGYNIHGNETSSMEAAIRTVYQLAAGTDAVTMDILSKVIVIIEPDQNPDGHDRYVQHVRSVKTVRSHPQTDDYEHAAPWPGGRTNHYLFDLNRDFYLKTQVESLEKTRVFHKYRPHVVIDAHEMGPNSTFFMAPANDPYAEYMSPMLFKWWDIIAAENAQWFNRYGWGYYTKESFDSFYPGYGESYPAINGSIGILYEQASPRGVSIKRDDGSKLTLYEATHHHFIASMSTLKAVADNRAECVRDFYKFYSDALASVKDEEIREIIIHPENDPVNVAKLLKNMLEEKVEIYRAQSGFTAKKATSYFDKTLSNVNMPEGAYIIPLDQPQKVLIKTLLAPESPMSDEFLAAEKQRKEDKERSHIYDITAWSMPLTYGLETYWTAENSKVEKVLISKITKVSGGVSSGEAEQAYLIPYNSIAGSKMLVTMFEEDIRVRMARKQFTIVGKTWDKGTLVVRVNRNDESVHEKVRRLAEEFGVQVTAVNDGLSQQGNDLGSNFISTLKKPKIAIVTGPPVSSYSFGAMHYLFEREFGLSFTRITVDRLKNPGDYNVIVLPAGNYANTMQKKDIEKLKTWISEGGTIVSVSSSTEWLKKAELSKVKMLNDMPRPDDEEKKIKPDRTPGAILKVNLNPLSYLSYGCPETIAAIVTSDRIYLPFEEDKFKNAGLFESGDKMLLSGFAWPETEEYLMGKGFLFRERIGRGKLVMFTEDPNFRAMFAGLNKLFLNAIILSPSFN